MTAAGAERQDTSRKLVVIFHGLGAKRDRLEGVRRAVEERFPSAKVIMPRLKRVWHLSLWISNADPVRMTRLAIQDIERELAKADYDEIILVGYSMGGILARKLAVYAWGQHDDAPFEESFRKDRGRRPWAGKITRIVLLAGMNRGWSFAPSVNVLVNLVRKGLYVTARLLRRSSFLSSIRRGAPFVADLRIQWLSLMRHEPDARKIVVVQLLGTIDDVVSPEDNIDLETGSTFYYLDVPASGHPSIIDFDEKHIGPLRRAAFLDALTGSGDELGFRNVLPLVEPHHAVDLTVQHVLFVMHGIRDHGFWTSHLARFIVRAARDRQKTIVALTPTYGYFAMLPFALPHTRREKVRWFMDQYTQALARFPNAEHFSYVGHSNGTYLLAGALRDYSGCHFRNVVFAGSVVRDDYPWESFIASERVERVLNFVATSDWVVAVFPRFLGKLGADVGGAGHDGFTKAPERLTPEAPVNNAKYVAGSHFAALREQHWQSIADFIIDGDLPPEPEPASSSEPDAPVEVAAYAKDPGAGVQRAARLAPVIWLVLLAIVFAPVVLFVGARREEVPDDASPWQRLRSGSVGARGFVTLLWFWLMRTILTRV